MCEYEYRYLILFHVDTDVSKELSSFEIPGCFPIVKASNSNYVKIYRNSGYLAPITIKEYG